MTQATAQPADPTTQPAADPPRATGSIARRAMAASAFTLIEKFGLQVLRFVSNILLAWWLSPAVFGLMAMVNPVKGILSRVSDIGIRPAVIQHADGDDPEFLDTAWTMQVIRGVALGLIVAIMGYPLAYWIPKDPQTAMLWLAPLAGLMPLIVGLQTTKVLTHQRHLDVKRLMKYELGCNLLGTCVTLLLAFLLKDSGTVSVIALVLGGVVAATTNIILTHLTLPGHRNRLRFNMTHAKAVWSFGKWVAFSSILTALAVYSDKLIFSAVVSIELVGIYSIAWGLATQPVEVLLPIGRKAVFPALCRAIEAGKDLSRSVARCKAPLLVAGAWSIACMSVAGPALIRGAYKPAFEAAQWMLPMLAFAGWMRILASTNGSALMAVAKPQSIAYGNLIKLILMFVLIPIGLYYEGMFGAVLALVLTELPKYAWSVYAIAREKVDPMLLDAYTTVWLVLTACVGYGVVWLVREPIITAMPTRPGEILVGAIAVLSLSLFWVLPGLWAWRAMKLVKVPVKPEGAQPV